MIEGVSPFSDRLFCFFNQPRTQRSGESGLCCNSRQARSLRFTACAVGLNGYSKQARSANPREEERISYFPARSDHFATFGHWRVAASSTRWLATLESLPARTVLWHKCSVASASSPQRRTSWPKAPAQKAPEPRLQLLAALQLPALSTKHDDQTFCRHFINAAQNPKSRRQRAARPN
jgi:hypothetical protein